MSQQITIIVLIDIQAALDAKSLDGNFYLLDNLRTEGSEGEGTNRLVTIVNGGYLIDHSPTSDIVLNWLPIAIGSLPSTLPKNYEQERSKDIEQENMQKIKKYLKQLKETSRNSNEELDQDSSNEELDQDRKKIDEIVDDTGNFNQIKDSQGNVRDLDVKALNVFGNQFASKDVNSRPSYWSPFISNITGEAVESGVLFPAQYGSPVPIKDGWYWSATVDTCRVGIYNYTLHITLYSMKGEIWTPVSMSCDARIKVTNQPQRNGFTNAGIDILPLV